MQLLNTLLKVVSTVFGRSTRIMGYNFKVRSNVSCDLFVSYNYINGSITCRS